MIELGQAAPRDADAAALQALPAPPNTSGFLQRLAIIMADDGVKTFFRDYFSTWSDTKAALMLMQTYVAIDDAYVREFGTRLPSEQIAGYVREIVGDKECRQAIVAAMSHYTSEAEVGFLQAYNRIAAKHHTTQLKLPAPATALAAPATASTTLPTQLPSAR